MPDRSSIGFAASMVCYAVLGGALAANETPIAVLALGGGLVCGGYAVWTVGRDRSTERRTDNT